MVIVGCCSVAASRLTLCNPVGCSTIPCLSLFPGVCSDSCPLSWWCHPTVSSSVTAFSYPQSFPASGSFPMSWLFTSGGQIIGASASVFPMNIQGWSPLGWTSDHLPVQGTLKSLLQHHNSKASILQCSAFFMVQFSHLYMTTGKSHSFDYMDLCGKVMALLFNTLSRFIIAFLPRSMHLLVIPRKDGNLSLQTRKRWVLR